MSCNGCRVLRKGCSESCVLRPCLQWIPTPEAQGHATVFVAKFFGRAGLMSCISNVPLSHRPALFQSLLYEACGRTLNPVSGAVGLLSTGNWSLCQAAVETVLRGGVLRAIPDLLNGIAHNVPNSVNQDLYSCSTAPPAADDSSPVKRHKSDDRSPKEGQSFYMDLHRAKGDFPVVVAGMKTHGGGEFPAMTSGRRSTTPSQNSEESGLSINLESGFAGTGDWAAPEPKLLNLFV